MVSPALRRGAWVGAVKVVIVNKFVEKERNVVEKFNEIGGVAAVFLKSRFLEKWILKITFIFLKSLKLCEIG